MGARRGFSVLRCMLAICVIAGAALGLTFAFGVAPAVAVGEAAWGEVEFPPGRTACYAIEQTSDEIVFGSFAGGTNPTGIERSYDGGQTWQTVCVAPSGTYAVWDIDFYSDYNGFAVGLYTNGPAVSQSLMLETRDGGLNWTRVDDALGVAENPLVAVDYDDWFHAAAVGPGGLFFKWDLDGVWRSSNEGTDNFTDVAVVHDGGDMRAVVVGDGGAIMRVTRNTSAWSFVSMTNAALATENLNCVADRGSSGSFVVFGDGGFELTSSNWGLNWTRGTSIGLGLDTQRYMAADFRDWTHGLVVGYRHHTVPTTLTSKVMRRTDDALATWSTESLPAGGSTTLTGVSMLSATETWAHSSDSLYHLAFPTLDRYGGADRYATAYEINARTFTVPYGRSAVFATGQNFPDALCAAGLAGTVNAPLIIVKNTLTASQLSQLVSLGVDSGYIVGGEDVVPKAVGDQLTAAGIQWLRYGGTDRYQTAALVADKVAAIHTSRGENTDWALVARGDMFPDALALAPLAYSQGMPILLTKPTVLPATTGACIDRNEFQYGMVAGDITAVSDAVKAQIDYKFISNGGSWAARWGGATRYETAAIIADNGITNKWATGSYIGVATGLNFPDALVGGCATGARSGVLLLTKPTALAGAAQTVIEDNRRYDTDMCIYGGEDVVGDAVMLQLSSLMP